jgi:hypothetical protein
MNQARACHRRATGRLKGFTLLEVLASLMFVGIVLPVAVGGLSFVLATAENARRQAEACELAQMAVPEDVAIVGAENFLLALSHDPGLAEDVATLSGIETARLVTLS